MRPILYDSILYFFTWILPVSCLIFAIIKNKEIRTRVWNLHQIEADFDAVRQPARAHHSVRLRGLAKCRPGCTLKTPWPSKEDMLSGEALHLRAKESDTPLTKQGQERIWRERHTLIRDIPAWGRVSAWTISFNIQESVWPDALLPLEQIMEALCYEQK